MNARGESMLDTPTLASIVQEAIKGLSDICDLRASDPQIATCAGQLIRRAMDHAVALSARNPDEDMLLEMWSGHALQGLLAGQNMGDLPALARDAMKAALALLAEYKAARA